MTTTTRGKLCPSCRRIKSGMAHEYNGRIYCCAGCVAKARWLIQPIPFQRSNR